LTQVKRLGPEASEKGDRRSSLAANVEQSDTRQAFENRQRDGLGYACRGDQQCRRREHQQRRLSANSARFFSRRLAVPEATPSASGRQNASLYGGRNQNAPRQNPKSANTPPTKGPRKRAPPPPDRRHDAEQDVPRALRQMTAGSLRSSARSSCRRQFLAEVLRPAGSPYPGRVAAIRQPTPYSSAAMILDAFSRRRARQSSAVAAPATIAPIW